MSREFKTDRAVQQQQKICDSLVRLMTETDYNQITVCDICAGAEVPRRTFYYYFDNKDEVLEYLLSYIIRECTLESMQFVGTDRAGMQKSFSKFYRYWRERRGVELKALLRNGFAGKLIGSSVDWIQTESLWAEELSKKITGLDAMGTQIGTTVVFYVLFYWCNGGFLQPEEDVAAYTTQLLTKPFYELQ